MKEMLAKKWENSLQLFGVADTNLAFFEEMAWHYTSEGRYYHNLNHIASLLSLAEQFKAEIQNFGVVTLAIWFHDVIYDSQAKDNEEQSAAYARQVLAQLGLPEPVISRVQALVLATKKHQPLENDPDCNLFLDTDLAILGVAPAEYDRYAQAIRQEYAWVAEADYRLGRSQVLETFLQRPRLYFTPHLFAAREQQARQNLAREIEALRQGL